MKHQQLMGEETKMSVAPVKQLNTSGTHEIPDGLRWLESLVASHRAILLKEPFYEVISSATSAADFSWARQLLHHSTEFPDVLALRRDLNKDHKYTDFLTQHVEEEVGHSVMLAKWLERNNLIPEGEAAHAPVATNATVACLSHAYKAAVTGNPSEHIVALNVAVEAASFDFFNQVHPILERLDLADEYWHLHTEADEFHSADGLAMLEECEAGSPEGRELAKWAREAAIFWGGMLNSWIGIDRWPAIPASI
ncbi:iron-containing redox enzyme family protein [Streptomyces sp. CG1]|uniref:iron-containing redox enzyme family protein n=1 Tax=Streptomyces sp. CG1 TaxID=1287523 RepID=UPI0034E2285B